MPPKIEAAGGATAGYHGQITLEFTIPHLCEPFRVKVAVLNTDYHNIAGLLVRTAVFRHSRNKCRDKYGIWHIHWTDISVAWVHAYQYLNASDNSSHTAETVQSINTHPGRTVNLPVVTRTLGTNESMEMLVEMMEKIPGFQYTPMLVSIKNDTTSEKVTIPVNNVSTEPIIIKADKDLFTLEPVLDVQCQATATNEV